MMGGPMVSHLAVIALTVASGMSATAEKGRPNILTVVVDDLGWGDVGYHDDTMHTPIIDGLAKEGVTLERFYTSPTCTPSRTQFMTGMYNIRIGMQDSVIHATEPRGVPLTATFLSDKMMNAGYQTAAIGKWHLGMHMPEYLPMSRGFEKHYGIYTGGGSHTKHLSVSQPVYVRDNVDEDIVYTGYNLWEDGTVSSDNFGTTHSTHLYAGKAVEYISDFDDSKPFFIYLAFQAVHEPMEVGNEAYITDTSCNDISSVGHENSETDYDVRKTLCGMMAEVDDGLNNIVLSLKSKGVYENTVIVFLSDNGACRRTAR
jgi:arylsulfatase A-like enzyme